MKTNKEIKDLAKQKTLEVYPIENTNFPIAEAIGFQKGMQIGYKEAQSERQSNLSDLLTKYAAYVLINADEDSRLGTDDWIKQNVKQKKQSFKKLCKQDSDLRNEVENLIIKYADEEHGMLSSKQDIKQLNNWIETNL